MCFLNVFTGRPPGTWRNPEQRLLSLSGMFTFVPLKKELKSLQNRQNLKLN